MSWLTVSSQRLHTRSFWRSWLARLYVTYRNITGSTLGQSGPDATGMKSSDARDGGFLNIGALYLAGSKIGYVHPWIIQFPSVGG
jgi:hypothetical protein